MLDKEAFISKYYNGASTAMVNDVNRFLDHVENLCAAYNEDITAFLQTKNCLVQVFFTKDDSVSLSHYQKIKRYIKKLLDFCGVQCDIPSRDEVLRSVPTKTMFRDLNSALNFITVAGKRVAPWCDETVDLAAVKSIVILGWYGFSPKEIATLRKDNVVCDGGYKVKHPFEDAYTDIDEQSYDILSTLGKIDSYQALATKRQINLIDSDLLFRGTARTKKDVPDGEHILKILSRFNAVISTSYETYHLNFKHLKLNRIFTEIYNDKSDLTLIQKIQGKFDCERSLYFGYKKQYEQWLSQYYPNN